MAKFLYLAILILILNPIMGYSQIYVTNTNDSGPGSLRQAIINSNTIGNSYENTIVFQIPVPSDFPTTDLYISLESPLPLIQWAQPGFNFLNTYVIFSSPPPVQAKIHINGNGLPGPGIFFLQAGPSSIPSGTFIGFKPATYKVTNNNNSGVGSLSWALMNASLYTNAQDTIAFNLPNQGYNVISLDSGALPVISRPVIIDGSTQPGFIDGKETIVINGNKQYPGLTLNTYCSNVEIYGLTFQNCTNGIQPGNADYSGFPEIQNITIGKKGKGNLFLSNINYGITMNYVGLSESLLNNISICNNFIGTDAMGNVGLGNGSDGINTTGTNSTISGNIISGNGGYGINTTDAFTTTRAFNGSIINNRIGTNLNGSLAIPNGSGGIRLSYEYGDTYIQGNIISGNNGDAVEIDPIAINSNGSINNLYFYNNLIGTDSSGKKPIPNNGNGITTDSYNSHICYVGTQGKGNIIAFNKGMAINNGNSAVIRSNSIFDNGSGIISTASMPIISNRSSTGVSGTAPTGTIVQLFYDDGFNKNAQGKTFIAEVYPNAGNWSYSGPLTDFCSVTAIAIDTINNTTSPFSITTGYSLGPDVTYCLGDTMEILDAGPGYSSYKWSTGDTTRTIKILKSGIYSVNVYNGCNYSDTIQVNFVNRPLVSLGKDTTLCYGKSISLNAGIKSGVGYSWYINGYINADTIALLNTNPYVSESIIAKVSIGKCTNSDTINVTVVPVTAPSVSQSPSFCLGQRLVLKANYYPSDSVFTKYLWSNGSTKSTDTITQTGIYSVKVYNSCFTSYDTFSVNSIHVDLGRDTAICQGHYLNLNAGNSGATYLWSNGSTNQNISVTATGTYWVKVTQGSCIQSDTIHITVLLPVSLNLNTPQTICKGSFVALNALNPGNNYLWSDGKISRYDTLYNPGKYWIKVYNSCFTITDTITIIPSSLSLNLGKDTTVCGSSILLNAGNDGANYLWNNGSNNQTNSITSSGKYYVQVSQNSCVVSDTISITLLPAVLINLGKNQAYCPSSPIIIDAGNAGASFLWSDGKTTQKDTITPNSGTYWVKVYNQCSSAVDTFKLQPITDFSLGNDTILWTGQSLTLQAGNNPGGIYEWNGNPNQNSQSITVNQTGIYYVNAQFNGCTFSDTIEVAFKDVVNLGPDQVLCNNQNTYLNVYDPGAHILWSTGETTSDINVSKSGTYWVQVYYYPGNIKTDTVNISFINCNQVYGRIYIDSNGNCIADSTEQGIPYAEVAFYNTTTSQYSFAGCDNNGNYIANLIPGNYTVYLEGNSSFTQTCPSLPNTYTITVNSTIPNTGINFGVQLNQLIQYTDILSVFTMNVGNIVRLGKTADFILEYRNISPTVVNSGQVKLILDPFLTLNSISVPYNYISGDTMIWNYSSLQPGETRIISYTVNVPLNISLYGKVICNEAFINPAPNEQVLYDNYESGCVYLSYPFDPNSMSVSPEGSGTQGLLSQSDTTLNYTVHFQNTGTDTAYNVIIIDSLPASLNASSIQVTASSNNYTYTISPNGVVTWAFNNIMLPDSSANLSGSVGFISYSVNLAHNLPSSTSIENDAIVYFDSAPGEQTNTVQNTTSSVSDQFISFPQIPSIIYSDTSFALKATASSGLSISYAASGPVTISNDSIIITGAGNVRVRAYQMGNNNFSPANFTDQVFTINKANQIITFDSIPPQINGNYIYTLKATGGNSGQPIIYTVLSGPATIIGNQLTCTGTGIVTVTASQPGNNNYNAAKTVSRTFFTNALTTSTSSAISNPELRLYPNPTSDRFTIDYSDAIKTGEHIDVYTVDGILMKNINIASQKQLIDCQSWPAGIYMIHINSYNLVIKLVVMH